MAELGAAQAQVGEPAVDGQDLAGGDLSLGPPDHGEVEMTVVEVLDQAGLRPQRPEIEDDGNREQQARAEPGEGRAGDQSLPTFPP